MKTCNPDRQSRPVSPDRQCQPVTPDRQGRPVTPDRQSRPVTPDRQGIPVSPERKYRSVAQHWEAETDSSVVLTGQWTQPNQKTSDPGEKLGFTKQGGWLLRNDTPSEPLTSIYMSMHVPVHPHTRTPTCTRDNHVLIIRKQ